MSIGKRINQIIKQSGLTNTAFADAIGVQRSSISHVLSGRNKPSIDFIQKILLEYPETDSKWLLTGINSVVTERKKDNLASQKEIFDTSIINDTNVNKLEVKELPITEEKTKETVRVQPRKIKQILILYNDDTFETVKNFTAE